MVRFGLGDSESDDDDELDDAFPSPAPRRSSAGSPFAAPTEDDDELLDADPPIGRRSSYSPGGLFSSGASGFALEESRGPASRERMGLAAQLGLDADATRRGLDALSPRDAAMDDDDGGGDVAPASPPRALVPLAPPAPPAARRGARPAARSKTLARARAAEARRGAAPSGGLAAGGDYGLRMGRSFRACLGAGGRVAFPVKGGGFRVATARVSALGDGGESLGAALEVALAHAVAEEPEAGALPARGYAPADAEDAASPTYRALGRCAADYGRAFAAAPPAVAAAWRLVDALFFAHARGGGDGAAAPAGAPPARLLGGGDDDDRAANCARVRRDDAVHAWLAAEAGAAPRDALAADEDDRDARDVATWTRAFEHLAAHEVEAACELCCEREATRLALMAASRSDPNTWEALGLEFDRCRSLASAEPTASRALYARCVGAIAGRLELEDELERDAPGGAAGLPWRARLGLHAWYGHGELGDALDAYDAAAAAGAARLPTAEVGGRAVSCHHALLKLGCEGPEGDAGALRCLDAFGAGLRHGDDAHAWHLALVLDALGAADVADGSLAALAASLCYELAARGDWHWALFVVAASHREPAAREALARDLLGRHAARPPAARDALSPGAHASRGDASASYELKRSFCAAALGCPDAWFEAALADAATDDDDRAARLVGAEAWGRAHGALRALAPRALFAGAAGALAPLLEALEARVDDADFRGDAGAGLYLDHARFRAALDDARRGAAASMADDDAPAPDVAALRAAAAGLRRRVAAAAPPPGAAPGGRDAALHAACVQHLATELDDAVASLDAVARLEGEPAAYDDSVRFDATLDPRANLARLDALAAALVC